MMRVRGGRGRNESYNCDSYPAVGEETKKRKEKEREMPFRSNNIPPSPSLLHAFDSFSFLIWKRFAATVMKQYQYTSTPGEGGRESSENLLRIFKFALLLLLSLRNIHSVSRISLSVRLFHSFLLPFLIQTCKFAADPSLFLILFFPFRLLVAVASSLTQVCRMEEKFSSYSSLFSFASPCLKFRLQSRRRCLNKSDSFAGSYTK
jgi:hypothetical protein